MNITEKLKLDINSYFLPVLLIITNFIFKGIFLSVNSLGGDEPFSVYVSQANVTGMVSYLSTGNNPPLYEIILHYWIKCFGISEFSVRFPSLVFSCVTVLFIYRLGKQNFNIRVAIYSSLFFVFSNYQITYAHEARAYALMGMLTVISMYFFLEIVRNGYRTNLSVKIALVIVNVLLLYTHYFGFFVLLLQFLTVLFSRKVRVENIRYWLLGSLVLFLAYLPNITVLWYRFKGSVGIGGTWLTPPSGAVDLYNMLWKFTNAPVVAALTIILFVLAFVKYLVLVQKNKIKNSFQTSIVTGWFLLPFIGMFLISYWTPIFLDRYLMFVSIGFCLFLAVVADFLIVRKSWKYVIPIVFSVLFILTSKPNFSNKRNVHKVVNIVKEFKGNTDALILFCPRNVSHNIAYYFDRTLFNNPNVNDINRVIDEGFARYSVYGINNIDEVDYNKHNHIVYLDAASNFSFPQNGILDSLSAHYRKKRTVIVDDFFVIYDFDK